MLHSDYPDQVCSIARALEVIGERWTLLILRDVLLGTSRFDDLVDSLGVTRTVLSRRLDQLVADGVLERTVYQHRPTRHAYTATAKGQALGDVLAALMRWGDTYYPHPDGPPRILRHQHCGGTLVAHHTCSRCGHDVSNPDIDPELGPALRGRQRERTPVGTAVTSGQPGSSSPSRS